MMLLEIDFLICDIFYISVKSKKFNPLHHNKIDLNTKLKKTSKHAMISIILADINKEFTPIDI